MKTCAQLADLLHDFPWMCGVLLTPVDWADLEQESGDLARTALYATLPRLWSVYDAPAGLGMLEGVLVDSLWAARDLERYSVIVGADAYRDLDPTELQETMNVIPIGYAWEVVVECPSGTLTVRWNGEVDRHSSVAL